MKEHFQDQGVRKWAGDDLIELQSESLVALQGLVEPYAPCIIKGCEVSLVSGSNYKVSAGLVALHGNDHTGAACVKVARVDEIPSTILPVYLTLTYTTATRVYSDGKSKAVSHNYMANVSTVQPEEGEYLTIGVDGGPRLVDTLGISAKLEREGGEAKDVKVSFVQASSRNLPESGSKLGIIIGLVRKWFADLKALAFKDKVAEADLESALSTKINNKVDKVTGKGLSENDFTDSLKDKLNGIDAGAEINVQSDWAESSSSSDAYIKNKPGNATTSTSGLMSSTDKSKLDGIAANANNYSLPVASSNALGGIMTGYPSTSNNRAVLVNSEKAYVNIPTATASITGLMSSADKVAVDEFKSSLRIVSAFAIETDGRISQCVGLLPTVSIGSRGDATGKTYLIKLNPSGGFSTSKRYGAMALAGYGHTVEKYEPFANGNGYISLIQRNLSGEPDLSGYAPWVILFELN